MQSSLSWRHRYIARLEGRSRARDEQRRWKEMRRSRRLGSERRRSGRPRRPVRLGWSLMSPALAGRQAQNACWWWNHLLSMRRLAQKVPERHKEGVMRELRSEGRRNWLTRSIYEVERREGRSSETSAEKEGLVRRALCADCKVGFRGYRAVIQGTPSCGNDTSA